MRVILYILQKEFIQIFRDKTMLPIILLVPLLQLLILSYTATFEIKNVRLAVLDFDRSVSSRALISGFRGSDFYQIKDWPQNLPSAEELMKKGEIDQILVIDSDFETELHETKSANLQLITDAINGNAASLMNAYGMQIIQAYSRQLNVELIPAQSQAGGFRIKERNWYNPELDYITYMVPGILVLLVTIIGMFLSGMNVVKEKEIGTIEQINVTPIKKYQFIIGKLMPFLIIALIELLFGLAIAKFVFQIPFLGSLPLLLGVATVYLLVVLAIGLLVSTMTDTIQQAMFISWFFLVIFILMSGLFTPIESMPDWAQSFNKLNPISYFIEINRMIMLKGSSFSDFKEQFYTLLIYASLLLSLAIWRYRKKA